MCGIMGIVGKRAVRYRENLEKMIISLKHRGTDGQGAYYFPECALGHVRLSIIDVTNGQQPMLGDSGQYGIVFNGEIYGYRKLKEKFCEYPFQNNSDTELILAMYKRFDIELLRSLPGMFGFAIWDEQKQRLCCARDRFGEKPFYYAVGENGEFVFGSEIKSIIASGLVKPTLNVQSLGYYLNYSYIHPEENIYKNIHTLPPAHYLLYENGEIIVKRYWDLPEKDESWTLEDATEKFQELLRQAVRRQLVADVPVGAFLSGGLDSGTIVALASEYTDQLTTFSFGFKGDVADETPLAVTMAKKYHCNHIELYDDSCNLAEVLVKLQGIYDEPLADSSCIPTYLISKLTSKYVKVALTGDGGDELLGGYTASYRPLCYMKEQNHRMSGNSFFLQMLLHAMTARFRGISAHDRSQKRKSLWMSRKYASIGEAHQAQRRTFSNKEMELLGVPILDVAYQSEFVYSNTVDDALRIDLQRFMPADILVKIDRASMANGLELRAPFLDIDFASFCIQLPYQLKLNAREDKILLKAAFSNYWTEEIKNRPKRGFNAPVRKWLQQDDFRILQEDYLRNKTRKIFSILDYDGVQHFVKRGNQQVWILLVLSIWLELHEVAG